MTLPKEAIKGTPILFEVVTTLDTASNDILLTYFATSVNKREVINASSKPGEGITLTGYVQSAGNHVYTWECLISPDKTSLLSSDVFFSYCQLFIGLIPIPLETQVLVFSHSLPLIRPS